MLHSYLTSVLTLPESPSPAPSSNLREDEAPPLRPSHAILELDTLPVPSTSGARREENIHTLPSEGTPMFKRWLQTRFRRSNKDAASHKPNRLSGKSRQPAEHQSPSHLPTRVDATNEGPSWMATGKRKRVSVFP